MRKIYKSLIFSFIILFSLLHSCKKEDTTKESPTPKITRFCWVCETNIHQKNYECATLMSTAGSMFVGRTTKCDFTEEEIRAYETSLSSVSTVIVDATPCVSWGHPKKMYTKETKVTCKKKE